jgi:hypothetical protein
MKKNTTTIVSIGAVLALLLGGGWLLLASGGSGGVGGGELSASALTAMEEQFDFESIPMNGGDVSHRFELKNEGEEPVIIEKVYTSCMCTSAYVVSADGTRYGSFGMPGHATPSKTAVNVAPGESAFVEAVFDPAAHGPAGVGLAQRSIYLETNSAQSPKIELAFQALVTR